MAATIQNFAYFCRHCGVKQGSMPELRHHVAIRHFHSIGAPGRPTSEPGNGTIAAAVQTFGVVTEPKRTIPYCDVCEREFTDEAALRMHVQNSKIHKNVKRPRQSTKGKTVKSTPLPALGTVKSNTSLLGRQPHIKVTETPSRYKQTEGGASARMQAPTGLQFHSPRNGAFAAHISADLQLPDTIANGATSYSTPCRGMNDGWASFQHGNNRWSLVPVSQQQAALEALEASCHPPEDLRKQKYLLLPYSPDDIAGLRKCRNCGGKLSDIIQRIGSHLNGRRPTKGYTISNPNRLHLPSCKTTDCGEHFRTL
jgi:hypothetical protein